MEENVLIAPIGTEAQIVTTAVDLLARKNVKISEAVVLHSTGDPQLEAAAERLKAELAGFPDLQFSVKPFEREGTAVRDLNTEKEAEILLYCLYNEVRVRKNRGCRIFLLCSGGRKIIAAYAMLIAQMLFDSDDSLLYLISQGEYLRTKKMRPENAGDLRETVLLEIPFLEWGAVLPSVTAVRQIEDPSEAYAKIRDLELEAKYRKAADFAEKQCTKAEAKVLEMAAARGFTNLQIAEEKFTTERTVETQMRSVLRKASWYFGIPEISRARLTILMQPYYQMKLREK